MTANTVTRSLRRRPVHLYIVERREGHHHCQPERFLARNQIIAQHAPRTLPIANPNGAGVAIDRNRKLRTARQNFFRQQLRNLYAPRAAEMSADAIGNVSPAFEKDAAGAVFSGDVEAPSRPRQ